MTGQTDDDGKISDVEIMVPLKYLSNLYWPANCVIIYTNVANQGATFAIAETKLYF